MTTPGTPVLPASGTPAQAPERPPVRLRMGRTMGVDRLDGGWWPRSRDLAAELGELIDHLPASCGRVVRARFSPPDWDPAPGAVAVNGGGHVTVDPLPGDDAHVIVLETSDLAVLHVLVVPPGFSEDQGAEALLAAATGGNGHPAGELLAAVVEYPDVDPADHWEDDGGSWWGDREAPSFRSRVRG
ncbi:DUF5994 family protein [Nocardioides ginsengisoli]|uniref:DUF5994 family protein n=2 Tax=Nocardioides ginsengisoli TaxID=363868 RepID=A0ABW3VXF0_9ACTN